MAKKQYFITVDTETTISGKVADFAAVVTDRGGNIITQCAVLVAGVYNDREKDPLFYDTTSGATLWSKNNLTARYSAYDCMIESGIRMLASPSAINKWLQKANDLYDPTLTAYNLPFDLGKCTNTGIDLSIFKNRFCLWAVACAVYAKTKPYLHFILDTHAFNPPTGKGNMTFKTNAEVMTRFITNQPDLEDEPHTALEDVLYYELEILNRIVKRFSTKKILEISTTYNWREFQVKNWFTV